MARVILRDSTEALSYNRVPPNFLVGKGASDYAYESGLVVLHNDALISPGAKERWLRWLDELRQSNESEGQGSEKFFRRPIKNDSAHFLRTPSSMSSKLPADSPADANASEGKKSVPSDSQRTQQSTPEKPMGSSADNITDTVGAIAVDLNGNIAAGSSSGGVGMKHRGRIGPAALVGIGTAVIPAEPKDPEGKSVAVVTSGTGEHIATTLGASTCASRIYHAERKRHDGSFESITEEEAMNSTIKTDFMGKPCYPQSFPSNLHSLILFKATLV